MRDRAFPLSLPSRPSSATPSPRAPRADSPAFLNPNKPYCNPTGYKASVFNLVYVSNVASLRIWDALGFSRVGLVPDAGLLKSATEGEPDVFTDAVVYHKTF